LVLDWFPWLGDKDMVTKPSHFHWEILKCANSEYCALKAKKLEKNILNININISLNCGLKYRILKIIDTFDLYLSYYSRI